MTVERKIAMVVNQVKMEDEDALDLAFWQHLDPSDRLREVCRLRRQYYTWLNGSFPDKMIKKVKKRKL
jgi:hypothetical protein